MPKVKSEHKKNFIHIYSDKSMKAYRTNDYEYSLLKKIQEYEHFQTEAETLRVILRESARARNLHPSINNPIQISEKPG